MDDFGKGLDVGSFSSGQVADPLGIDSRKDSWLREKHAGEEKGRVSGNLFSTTPNFPACSKASHFKPDHGIATEASMVNRSHDLVFFA